jgi:meiosis-specific transcription factor NDT80
MNQGGFRSSGSHYSGSVSGGSNGYRSNHYGLNMPNDHPGSHSGSSSSSIDGGPIDGYQVDTVMSDADRIAIHEHDGYQYYPSTIYEGMATQLPPLGKIESNARFSTEPRQYAVKAEYSDAIPGAQFPASNIGRFQGVESSRGYYPDLQAGCS